MPFVLLKFDMATESPPYAATALALSIQDWDQLSLGDDPTTRATADFELMVDRVTALMLVRITAVVSPLGTYQDLSISNICRRVMMKSKPWPEKITDSVLKQLREYVTRILQGYKDNPYHNKEHAVHVVTSTNKLVEIMLSNKKSPTFGLRNDPLMLLAQLYSALIHDVEHTGVPNRTLQNEDDRLAVLYNDQSIAENWSLYVGFSELLQDEFKELREVMFATRDEYLRFRKAVITIVLATDIASPERTQILKSRWKEAFGDPYETVERKVRARRMSTGMTGKEIIPGLAQRRPTNESHYSELSAEIVPERDDDSASLTPDNTGHGEDPDNIAATPLPHAVGRSASLPLGETGQTLFSKFERRMSACSRSSKYKQRLGLLRTVDLSGETLESYSRHSRMSIGGYSTQSSEHASVDIEADDPDDLKAFVVMETIMTAADVAHNLQGWEHMVKWSNRLYMELRKAYHANRGMDPKPKWFENQIGFLESYLLPLAHKLEDTGVFGETAGALFSKIVESNRDNWLTDGYDVTQEIIQLGAEEYPIEAEV